MTEGLLGPPTAPWVPEVLGPLVWLALASHFTIRTVRDRRLSVPALMLIAFTSMHWGEWYADWGGYVYYNPAFHLMPWGTTRWTTPYKPWFMLPAYGWFFLAYFQVTTSLLQRGRKRWPTMGRLPLLAVLVVPTLFVFDLVVEGFGTATGWHSFSGGGFGPEILWPNGAIYRPLFMIVFFAPFGVITTALLDLRESSGRHRFEVAARVDRLRAGWQRELARAGVWIVTMNVLFFATLALPLILYRTVAGTPSQLVP